MMTKIPILNTLILPFGAETHALISYPIHQLVSSLVEVMRGAWRRMCRGGIGTLRFVGVPKEQDDGNEERN